MSGEVEGDIGEAYRLALLDIQDMANAAISKNDYGDVMEWALIPIIMNPEFGTYDEIKRYWRKKKETEFRLKIDHAAFKAADDMGKRKLLFAMVLRSIDEGRKLEIPQFDFDRFEHDVRSVGEAHGWL